MGVAFVFFFAFTLVSGLDEVDPEGWGSGG